MLSFAFFILVYGDNSERRLFQDLLRDYDVRIRPVNNHKEPVNVTIGVDIVKILSVVRFNFTMFTMVH